MNSRRNLLKRLLGLFPVKVLKEYFNETGNAADVIEIISGNQTEAAIQNFAKRSYNTTRQHIHFYSLGGRFNPNILTGFPINIIAQDIENGVFRIFSLAEITFNVVLNNPLEEQELKFLQPVIIKIENNVLTVHFTKLEKNVTPYFDERRNPVKTGQVNSETDILNLITQFFNNALGLTPLDINRGVKHLWENDYIDCSKVQWRKDSSVATETMDEELLFKERYPAEYAVLIQQPLVKTYFKYIRSDDYFCDNFDLDPGNGQLNIPKFPKTSNQVNHVITEILTHN